MLFQDRSKKFREFRATAESLGSRAINGAWRAAHKAYERVRDSKALPVTMGLLYLNAAIYGAAIGHDDDHADDSSHSKTFKIGDSSYNVLGYVKSPDGGMSLKLQLAPGLVCYWDQPEQQKAPCIVGDDVSVTICGNDTKDLKILARKAYDVWTLDFGKSYRDRLGPTSIYVGETLPDTKAEYSSYSDRTYQNVSGDYTWTENLICMPVWIYRGDDPVGASNLTGGPQNDSQNWTQDDFCAFREVLAHESGHEYCDVTRIISPFHAEESYEVGKIFAEERANLTPRQKDQLNPHHLTAIEGVAHITGTLVNPERTQAGIIQACFPRTTEYVINNITRECGTLNLTTYNEEDFLFRLYDTLLEGSLEAGPGTVFCGDVYVRLNPDIQMNIDTDKIVIGEDSVIGKDTYLKAPITLGANTLVDSNMSILGDGFFFSGFKAGNNNVFVSPDFQAKGPCITVSAYNVGNISNQIFIYDAFGDPDHIRIPTDPFDRCMAVAKVKQDLGMNDSEELQASLSQQRVKVKAPTHHA